MRLIVLILLLPFYLYSQPPVDRYQVDLFGVTETNNVIFSTGVPQPNEGGGFYEWVTGYPLNVNENDTSPINLEMDIFEPTGDTLEQRPLVIVCFGGGFLSGSKDHWSIRLICQNLAKRGYVAAAIDYRLGMNIFDADLANRAVYRGLQDARSAVRFFRADADNANTYKIDPDHIFIGGHSSGGFMALHNAYLDQEIERPISTYAWVQDGQPIPDQQCLDCVGDNTVYSGHANAIFSLAGALGFTSFIESGSDPKVVMFHSTDDGTVPYDSGEPFSSILWLVVGSDLPEVYGSQPITEQADIVGLPYEFFSYTNRGHDVHEASSSALYSDIMPGISDWFFNEELKPEYNEIIGDSIICNNEMTKEYSLEGSDGVYFDWKVTGGTILSTPTHTNSITIDWDQSAPLHSLKVTPYNHLDAKGAELELPIDIQTYGFNSFQYNNTTWEDSINWTLNHPPISCEDVLLGDSENPMDIIVQSATEINSLELGSNVQLTLNSPLLIHQKNVSSLTTGLYVKGQITNNSVLRIANNSAAKEVQITPSGTLINTGDLEIED